MDREPTGAKLASFLVVFVGCSSSSLAKSDPDVSDGSASSELAEPLDATFSDRIAPSTSAATSDAGAMLSDGAAPASGLGERWDGRAPESHVASAPVCPQQRGPGFVGCNLDGGVASPTALVCLQDSDCTMGKNGRCTILPVSSPPPGEAGDNLILLCGSSCSYDTCFSDSDCPPRVPCGCRAAASDNAANVCLTGSNCAVDSDCGPGGFCSPTSTEQTGGQVLYFCHTASDACFDNSDCATHDGCQFDTVSARWICVAPLPPAK